MKTFQSGKYKAVLEAAGVTPEAGLEKARPLSCCLYSPLYRSGDRAAGHRGGAAPLLLFLVSRTYLLVAVLLLDILQAAHLCILLYERVS